MRPDFEGTVPLLDQQVVIFKIGKKSNTNSKTHFIFEFFKNTTKISYKICTIQMEVKLNSRHSVAWLKHLIALIRIAPCNQRREENPLLLLTIVYCSICNAT